MGTDGGHGTKGPVVCTATYSLLLRTHKGQRVTDSLTLHRVILVHKVQEAIADPQAHQDLREALVSLVLKDNW